MSHFLETHFYDGHIKHIYKELSKKQDDTTNFKEIKWDINFVIREIIDNLKNLKLNELEKKVILNGIGCIINDQQSNYDPINEIDVLDILCRTWYFVKRNPIEDQLPFYSQLGDITNGSCSQGRTTRIFQIFYTFF